MKYFEDGFSSADGKSRVIYTVWEPEGETRAVLQISHGMCEYIGRYEKLAQYMTAAGIAVCGNDHIGHGRTAKDSDELGYIPRGGGDMLVEDLHTMSGIARERFPGRPLFLLGHSMGSFVARLYAAKYGSELDGVVFMGTGGPGNPTGLGKFMAVIAGLGNGGHKRAGFVNRIAFGSYNKHFKDEHSPYSWLSKNAANVREYSRDDNCTFIFTADGFHTLFDMLGRVSDKSWAASLPKTLPILLVSGDDDPVGDYGNGVKKVAERISAAGALDMTLKLYPGDRHEILKEADGEVVCGDILAWLEARMGKDAK